MAVASLRQGLDDASDVRGSQPGYDGAMNRYAFVVSLLVLAGIAGAAGCSEEANGTGGGTTIAGTPGGSGGLPGGQGGTPTGSGGTSAGGGGSAADDPWLRTEGNHIVRSDGSIWRGRGANVHDTRSCNACTWYAPDVNEVLRRIDELVDVWGANFIRLDLESYAEAQTGQVHWASLLDDPAYFADVVTMVEHVGTKPDVYVLLSLWIDPSQDDNGWPTAQTHTTWEALAGAFLDAPYVMYGIINEPEYNFDGSLDDQVWQRMDDAVAAIRTVEDGAGARRHIVAVQGTGGWARRLDYYVDHPITAGGGENVAYEIHVYNPESDFEGMLAPASTLPVIIGEHGPSNVGNMTVADCEALQVLAESRDIPYLAWTFHQRCPPNLIEETASGCGIGMDLVPTTWGQSFQQRLAAPWGSP